MRTQPVMVALHAHARHSASDGEASGTSCHAPVTQSPTNRHRIKTTMNNMNLIKNSNFNKDILREHRATIYEMNIKLSLRNTQNITYRPPRSYVRKIRFIIIFKA